ncbi:hypothetical protein D3C72_1155480 [compost metagenome]
MCPGSTTRRTVATRLMRTRPTVSASIANARRACRTGRQVSGKVRAHRADVLPALHPRRIHATPRAIARHSRSRDVPGSPLRAIHNLAQDVVRAPLTVVARGRRAVMAKARRDGKRAKGRAAHRPAPTARALQACPRRTNRPRPSVSARMKAPPATALARPTAITRCAIPATATACASKANEAT